MSEATPLPPSRSAGMKTKRLSPAWAPCAETALPRLPVEAHATVSKPNSLALVIATDTTRSLKENVGWQTESSLTQTSRSPSALARLVALRSEEHTSELQSRFGISY